MSVICTMMIKYCDRNEIMRLLSDYGDLNCDDGLEYCVRYLRWTVIMVCYFELGPDNVS